MREENQGGKSGGKIRENNQGQPGRTVRNLRRQLGIGGQSGRRHMREKQVTWKERRDTFQNKTGSHETKPHCNPYADSIYLHMLPPTYHFQVYKNTADLSDLLCSSPTTSCSHLLLHFHSYRSWTLFLCSYNSIAHPSYFWKSAPAHFPSTPQATPHSFRASGTFGPGLAHDALCSPEPRSDLDV